MGPEAVSMEAAAVALEAEAVRTFDNAKEISGDFTGVVRTLPLKIFSSPRLNNPWKLLGSGAGGFTRKTLDCKSQVKVPRRNAVLSAIKYNLPPLKAKSARRVNRGLSWFHSA
jgi:hypothetical protein